MKTNKKVKLQFILFLFILIYLLCFSVNEYTTIFDALMTLFLSAILLYKSRKNKVLFLLISFIFYCNYSIVIGEYLILESYSLK